jgi:predicted DCC family thiol-disulfide oxidoreductase YuxK
MAPGSPTLIFDGVCNLCNGAVQWVIRHDPRAVFRFAALQSEAGQALLAGHALPLSPRQSIASVVLVDGERVWFRSDAALEVLCRLGGVWGVLRFLRLVPRPIRDAIYDWVARHRYNWFGRRDECWLPTPELRRRFVDGAR